MADGKVTFEITVDASKADRAVDNIVSSFKDAGVKIDNITDNMGKNMAQSADKAGNAFGDMFKKISIAATAAKVGKELFDFGKQAIAAASDLQEVQNVVDTTFGESADEINRWAQNAGKQFGLTETQAKKFASTLGAMMKSAGMAGPEIVEMSENLSGLAADMASFYNLDFDTAFQKIRSGISGESEPLKALGVNLSAANLEAFRLEQGLTKSYSAMDQGEQVLLRYQYLMQATADAQGDFARTSDGYANSLRMLETNIEQLKTNAGALLLPVVNEVVNAVNTIFKTMEQDLPAETILDKFAAIDLKTAEKIAAVNETANKAKATADILAGITGQTYTVSSLVEFVSSFGGALDDLDAAMEQANKGNYAATMEELSKSLEIKTGVKASDWTELFSSIGRALNDVEIDPSKVTEPLGEIESAAQNFAPDSKAVADKAKSVADALNVTVDASTLTGGLDIVEEAINGSKIDPSKVTKPIGEVADKVNSPGLDSSTLSGGIGSVETAINNVKIDPTKVTDPIGSVAEKVSNPGIDSETLHSQLATVTDELGAALEGEPPIIGAIDDTKKAIEETSISSDALTKDMENAAGALAAPAPEKVPVAEKVQSIKDQLEAVTISSKGIADGISAANEALEQSPTTPTPTETAIDALSEAVENPGINSATLKSGVDGVKGVLETAISDPPINKAITDVETAVNDADIKHSNLSTGIEQVVEALETEVAPAPPVIGYVADVKQAADTEISADNVKKGMSDLNAALGIGEGAVPAQPTQIPVVTVINGAAEDISEAGQSFATVGQQFGSYIEVVKAGLSDEDLSRFNLLVETMGSEEVEKMLSQWVNAQDAASNMSGVFNALSGEIDAQGIRTAVENLNALGIEVRNGEDAMGLWLSTCQDLVSTIPSLGSVINTQTGEIDGNISAVYDAIEAYRDFQTELATYQNLAEKQAVFSGWTGVQDAQKALVEARAALIVAQGKFDKLGISKSEGAQAFQDVVHGSGSADKKEAAGAYKELADAEDAVTAAEENLTRQTEAYEIASEQVAAAIDAQKDKLNGLAEETGKFTVEQQAAVDAALNAMAPALEQMASMYEKTYDSIKSDVESMFDGFDFKMPEVTAEDSESTLKGMGDSLKAQIEYMDQYMAMLETLKERGASSDLLGDLSDGSEESYENLSALMTSTDDELIDLNQKYAEAKAKREEFAKSLTDTTLEGDEEWQTLNETVSTALTTLTDTLGDDAPVSAAETTMQGILDAVTSKSQSISDAIDAVLQNWQKLEDLGFGGIGTGNGAGSSNSGTPHAGGLDYVPFNGYMARLHEGESVLTAEQSKAWRSMLNGPTQNASGIDYAELGTTIRDNVPNGNVYMDGTVVGRITAREQAMSYRTLERSGWRG